MSAPVPECAGIPSWEEPRTYYQVLGVAPFEQDPTVIEEAALGRAGHVRAYQLTHESQCTRELNQIAAALVTLLDPAKRQKYEETFGPFVDQDSPTDESSQAAPGEAAFLAPAVRVQPRGPCDIRLVYLSGTLRKAGGSLR